MAPICQGGPPPSWLQGSPEQQQRPLADRSYPPPHMKGGADQQQRSRTAQQPQAVVTSGCGGVTGGHGRHAAGGAFQQSNHTTAAAETTLTGLVSNASQAAQQGLLGTHMSGAALEPLDVLQFLDDLWDEDMEDFAVMCSTTAAAW